MKRIISLIIVSTLFLLSFSSMPQTHGYSSVIHQYNKILWEIEATPNEPFLMYYTGGGYWLAENNTIFDFDINSVDTDVIGYLDLGNVSVQANDTDIARDLTLGVWGTHTEWWPGLIIDVTPSELITLNETAYAAAERVAGNYLNGTMTSRYETKSIGTTDYDCIVFEYEQDPPGNQVTYLAYSVSTGVLIEANTSFTFATPYELAFRFAGFQGVVDFTPNLTILITIVGVTGGVIAAVVILVFVKLRKGN